MSVHDEGATGSETSGSTQVMDGGAVVTATPTSSTRVAGTVRVNLLPPEIAEGRVLRRIQFGSGVAAAAAAALVGLMYFQQAHNLSTAKDDFANAQTTNARLKAEQARLGNVDALFQQVDAADAMLQSAQAYEIHFSSLLDELSLRTPQNDYLNEVQITETPGSVPVPGLTAPTTGATGATGAAAAAPAAGATTGAAGTGALGTITISGVGYKHDDVAAWLDSFAQLTGAGGVYLTSSTEALVGSGGNAVPTVNWTSTAQLTLAALAPQDTTGGAGK